MRLAARKASARLISGREGGAAEGEAALLRAELKQFAKGLPLREARMWTEVQAMKSALNTVLPVELGWRDGAGAPLQQREQLRRRAKAEEAAQARGTIHTSLTEGRAKSETGDGGGDRRPQQQAAAWRNEPAHAGRSGPSQP